MKTKTVKITLEGFDSSLGIEKGCFVVKDREGNTQKYPLFEARMLVPKFVRGLSSTSLFKLHFVRGTYNLTLSQSRREFRNTLARQKILYLVHFCDSVGL
jgi:hypothetical protein